jgi:hypothetical protein
MNSTLIPAWRDLSEKAEQLPEFLAAPHGAGTFKST